jgi:hypothetical protein
MIAYSKNDEQNIFGFDQSPNITQKDNVKAIQNFYLKNSDSYFLNKQLKKLLGERDKNQIGHQILDDLNNREPWVKKYEAKVYSQGKSITDEVDKDFCQKIKEGISDIITKAVNKEHFTVDVMTDNSFKDIKKTEIKLLTKNFSGEYKLKRFDQCGDKLNRYQSIKYFIRVFIDPKCTDKLTNDVLQKIEECKNNLKPCN